MGVQLLVTVKQQGDTLMGRNTTGLPCAAPW